MFRNFYPVYLLLILTVLSSCVSMQNPERPSVPESEQGRFYTTADNHRIFVHSSGAEHGSTSVYVLSGYTGINHNIEKDVLSLLSDENRNRVIVIHPRGTGYSEGIRGDVKDYADFLGDYIEIINSDIREAEGRSRVILYGHSISTAICLAVAGKLDRIDGMILVNPPLKMKEARGMTPGFFDYMKYAGYMIFASHTPVVNMAGDPSLIENPGERAEAEARSADPLLVKYISMYMMVESKKILDAMPENAALQDSRLLLIYGSADSITEKEGCDLIYEGWGGEKEYVIIPDGPHGKETVLKAADVITGWLKE